MDIPGLDNRFGGLQHAGSLMVMKKALDAVEMQTAGLLNMMDDSLPAPRVDPYSPVGQKFDVKV